MWEMEKYNICGSWVMNCILALVELWVRKSTSILSPEKESAAGQGELFLINGRCTTPTENQSKTHWNGWERKVGLQDSSLTSNEDRLKDQLRTLLTDNGWRESLTQHCQGIRALVHRNLPAKFIHCLRAEFQPLSTRTSHGHPFRCD